MKILMLGWELPPYNTGGLGVACYQLCKALALRGFDIDFAVPYKEDHGIDFMKVVPALPYSVSDLHKAGGAYESKRVYSNDKKKFSLSNRGIPATLRSQQAKYAEAIAKIVKKGGYDAIHANDWLTFEAATLARGHVDTPIIAHVHSTEFDRAGASDGNPIIHEIEYNMLRIADRIIAVSNITKDLISERYDIPLDKIEVMHNSVDHEAFLPIEEKNVYVYLEAMKKQGYKVVVSLSRLTIQKGLTQFLQAARLALDKNPKLLFLVVGNGDQYHELIELTASLGISKNVLFTGKFVRGKVWRDSYVIGDMFVMSSISEPFGITALEAVGYGAAALISKQSGAGEVLKNILRFDYWDTRKLADQILALSEYEGLRKHMCENAVKEFRNMSWNSVAERCHSVYERAKGVLV